MAATNVKATPTTQVSTKATSGSNTSHPVLLQFLVGFVLIVIAAWFSNISEDTGNLGAAFFALLWLLWLMNNSSKIRSL